MQENQFQSTKWTQFTICSGDYTSRHDRLGIWQDDKTTIYTPTCTYPKATEGCRRLLHHPVSDRLFLFGLSPFIQIDNSNKRILYTRILSFKRLVIRS